MNVLINAFFGDIMLFVLVELESFWVRSIWDKWFLASLPVKSLSIWIGKPVNIFIDSIFADVFSSLWVCFLIVISLQKGSGNWLVSFITRSIIGHWDLSS